MSTTPILGSPKLDVPADPAVTITSRLNIIANTITTTAMIAAKIAAQNHPDFRGAGAP
jgi:hypothetical protein